MLKSGCDKQRLCLEKDFIGLTGFQGTGEFKPIGCEGEIPTGFKGDLSRCFGNFECANLEERLNILMTF